MSVSGASGSRRSTRRLRIGGEHALVVVHRGKERLRLGHLARVHVAGIGDEALRNVHDPLDLLLQRVLVQVLDHPLLREGEVAA
jgi:hypothetical protein